MSYRWIAVISALVVVGTLAGAARGASIQDQLSQLAKENAEGYLKPVADGLGADLNSGIYSSGKVHGILGFDFGFKVMASLPADAAKFFTPTPPSGGGWSIVPPTSPTAVGPKDQNSVLHGGSSDIPLPAGLDLKAIPLAVPQASVGLPFKTDVMIRYLPKIKTTNDIGDVSFWGFGLKHSVSQYIPFFPLDVAAYGMWQKLTVGSDLLKATDQSYGVTVSKSLLNLTVYGGLSKESSSLDVAYTLPGSAPANPTHGTPQQTDLPIALNFDSAASGRATIGVRVGLLPILYAHAEASKVFGADNLSTVLGGGLGLQLR